MKLILCTCCQDVIRLQAEVRKCLCGACGGRYLNDLDAEYWGEHAIPIGFSNPSLVGAIKHQPQAGMGETFNAFVIAKKCRTMHKVCACCEGSGEWPNGGIEYGELCSNVCPVCLGSRKEKG